MGLEPEVQLLIVNFVALLIAYFGIYPTLREINLTNMMLADVAICLACLVVAGLLFWGSGIAFSLVLFDTNWAWFSIVTLLTMELPFFIWFATKHGLWEEMRDDDDYD